MPLTQAVAGARIITSDINSFYNLLKGVTGSGEGVTLIYNAAGVIVFQPSSDPAAGTEMLQIKNNAGTRQIALTSDGKVKFADATTISTAPTSASGGTPALVFGAANAAGAAGTFIRTDDTIVDPALQMTNYHRFRFEPINTTAPNVVVTGSGAVASLAGRGIQMTTGVTNPSTCSIRSNLEASGAGGGVISKVRRLEIQGWMADTYASSNSRIFLTDESADTNPSTTARHIGIKNLTGTVTFSTADGTTEQTTDISANMTAATTTYIVITFDGTTAKCYINGTLRATHATNVPAAGSAPVLRAYIDNNSTANSRLLTLYCVDALFANS